MQGADVNRRVLFFGLTSLLLGGCGLLGDKSPTRLASITVQTAAKPAFMTAINRFAGVRHFQVKPAQLSSAAATTLKLERADMEITLSNTGDAFPNPLAWQVTCYKSHNGSRATPAEIDEMADEFLANVLAVPGVQLVSSEKAITGAAPSSPASSSSS